jgi:hypothetical protein
MPLKEYLGDSVYAARDRGNIILTTENGSPRDPSNIIILEPSVIRALQRFIGMDKEGQDE